jgi:hypothetical protein
MLSISFNCKNRILILYVCVTNYFKTSWLKAVFIISRCMVIGNPCTTYLGSLSLALSQAAVISRHIWKGYASSSLTWLLVKFSSVRLRLPLVPLPSWPLHRASHGMAASFINEQTKTRGEGKNETERQQDRSQSLFFFFFFFSSWV